jgi:menaquinone-dependent protoporphyrinogen oxidase
MGEIAIVYGTTEGQTAKIAESLASTLRELGHGARAVHAADPPADFRLEDEDGVIVAASVHEGQHQRYIRDWVTEHLAWLREHPSAFVSVSLTSADRGEEPDRLAQGLVEDFVQTTGWQPETVLKAAGALRYTHYSWLKRMLLKQISKSHGGPTDTNRDHEFTDWAEIRRFAESFADRLGSSGR